MTLQLHVPIDASARFALIEGRWLLLGIASGFHSDAGASRRQYKGVYTCYSA